MYYVVTLLYSIAKGYPCIFSGVHVGIPTKNMYDALYPRDFTPDKSLRTVKLVYGGKEWLPCTSLMESSFCIQRVGNLVL